MDTLCLYYQLQLSLHFYVMFDVCVNTVWYEGKWPRNIRQLIIYYLNWCDSLLGLLSFCLVVVFLCRRSFIRSYGTLEDKLMCLRHVVFTESPARPDRPQKQHNRSALGQNWAIACDVVPALTHRCVTNLHSHNCCSLVLQTPMACETQERRSPSHLHTPCVWLLLI